MVAGDRTNFAQLAEGIEARPDVVLTWAETGRDALDRAAGGGVDLLVTDERLPDMTGLELIGRLVTVNPMIDAAVASSLSDDDFHEAAEGLGIMARLPLRPGRGEGDGLLGRLEKIRGLMTAVPNP